MDNKEDLVRQAKEIVGKAKKVALQTLKEAQEQAKELHKLAKEEAKAVKLEKKVAKPPIIMGLLEKIFWGSPSTQPASNDNISQEGSRWSDVFNKVLFGKLAHIEKQTLDNASKCDAIIKASAETCSIVSLVPIPVADTIVISYIQTGMIQSLARVNELWLDRNEANSLKEQLQLIVGGGFLVQAGLTSALTIATGGILGEIIQAPIIWGITYGLGRVVQKQIECIKEGVPFEDEDAKVIYVDGKREGKDKKFGSGLGKSYKTAFETIKSIPEMIESTSDNPSGNASENTLERCERFIRLVQKLAVNKGLEIESSGYKKSTSELICTLYNSNAITYSEKQKLFNLNKSRNDIIHELTFELIPELEKGIGWIEKKHNLN